MLKFHPFEKYLAPNKKDCLEKTFRTASLFPFDKFANHFFLVINKLAISIVCQKNVLKTLESYWYIDDLHSSCNPECKRDIH